MLLTFVVAILLRTIRTVSAQISAHLSLAEHLTLLTFWSDASVFRTEGSSMRYSTCTSSPSSNGTHWTPPPSAPRW